MKKIIHAVRSCRVLRTMSLEEAKTLCLALTEQMAHEGTLAQRAPHPFRLRLYAVKPHLSRASLLLHIRFLVGSKKERTDIILGCFDAHIERMLKPRQRDPPAP